MNGFLRTGKTLGIITIVFATLTMLCDLIAIIITLTSKNAGAIAIGMTFSITSVYGFTFSEITAIPALVFTCIGKGKARYSDSNVENAKAVGFTGFALSQVSLVLMIVAIVVCTVTLATIGA